MPTKTITARVEKENFPQLQAMAKQAGLKTATFVSQIIYEKLGESKLEVMEDELAALRADVAELRADLAKATRAMLIVAGSKEPYEKKLAEEWVEKNLNR